MDWSRHILLLAVHCLNFLVGSRVRFLLLLTEDISIDGIDTEYCRLNAKKILACTPVSYLKNLQLHGSLFEENCTTGAVSSVNTSFYVDHMEPLDALRRYQEANRWILGELLDGHEFLIILPYTSRL